MKAIISCRFFLVLSLIIGLAKVSVAGLAISFDEPDTIYASNAIIDIIEHNGAVWMATNEGVNFSSDGGNTWLLYDSTNGMVADNISSIFSQNGRLWAGSGHTEIIGGEGLGFSDALEYTDDDGYNWFYADFDGIPNVLGAERSIYDITGHYNDVTGEEWLFFTGYAAGLLGSRDGGTTWRRMFVTPGDSIYYDNSHQPRLMDRYFSCVTDTTHGDSLFLWTGTASGIFKYAFAPRWEKPFSDTITSIVFCNDCGPGDSSRVFIGGNNGITIGNSSGGPFVSRFEEDGLPGPYISMLFAYAGHLFVGTMEDSDGPSTGLAVSTDGGDWFDTVSDFDDVIRDNRKISEMAVMRDRLYLAAEEAGLFVSIDTGQNWAHLWVDSSDTSSENGRNIVHAFDVLADTLRIGTDSGLVTWRMDSLGEVQSYRYDVFPESIGVSSAQVIKIRTQVFLDSVDNSFDSLAVWTINRPLTDSGSPVVRRSSDYFGNTYWETHQWDVITNDIAIMGDTAFMIGSEGLRYTIDGSNADNFQRIYDSLHTWVRLYDQYDDPLTVMAVNADTMFIGSENGFSISNNRGQTHRVYRVNTDSLRADVIRNYNAYDTLYYPLPGNFIPTLAIQKLDNENYARIWALTRPAVGDEETGLSEGIYKPMDSSFTVIDSDTLSSFAGYGIVWENRCPDVQAWNFAFNGDSVFAAANGDGLLFFEGDTALGWDTLMLENEIGDYLWKPGDSVFAVEVIGDDLYVGTEQLLVRLSLGDLKVNREFSYVDSTTSSDEVYAFPVPFKQSSISYESDGVQFHFTLKEESRVTLEIYDAAMNLVKRVIDDQKFQAGLYHGRNKGMPTWNGRNGKGDKVAVGIYYFKVETSAGDGDVRWGKLAVIP
ncbi:MAG: FlgD immunoglobulin-like domain containing protein [candidate division Zixibacteria bacterium]|nr:FlgD immunoglobulin-like domain containing protein [candidate division Zixibacteria bacterium]